MMTAILGMLLGCLGVVGGQWLGYALYRRRRDRQHRREMVEQWDRFVSAQDRCRDLWNR